LAAPFVALTLVPGWAKRLPKPGPWMVNLKHLLAFTLLGSAAWLLWVLGRGHGVDAMGRVLVLWVCVAVAVWIAGLGQRRSGRARGVSFALGLGIVLLSGAWLLPAALTPETQASAVEWARYDREAIRQELASGRAVFVNFTADWCITCKVNERTVLSRPAVHTAAAKNNIALYKADWTRPDQDIEAALAKYGKAGVPAYVVYSPRDPERPQILPELLTTQLLRDAFADAHATTDSR
ncbi:MAG: thioredoxin family protein, partial [Myxococcota bacterium]